jgi:hypothetical protein
VPIPLTIRDEARRKLNVAIERGKLGFLAGQPWLVVLLVVAVVIAVFVGLDAIDRGPHRDPHADCGDY